MPIDSIISGYNPWTVTVLSELAMLDEGQQYKDMMVSVQLIHLLATSRNVVIYKWQFKQGSELIELFYGQLTEK
jgi:hypothetical protein